MGSTLSDLRTLTRTTYSKIDPNAKVWDNNTLDFFINSGYDKVQSDMGYDIPECEGSTTIVTASGTQEYSKPSDFRKFVGMYYSTEEMERITKQEAMVHQSMNAKPCSYYLYGDSIGLYPVPDNSYSFTLMYKKKLPKLTDTQASELPEDYDDAISLYSCYLMMLSVEKTAKSNMALNQYTSKINSLFSEFLYDDENMTFN